MTEYLSIPRVIRAADAIMDQVERSILEGKVRPGQKLPSERSLAEEFDVSRPTVREAIQKLEARGLVQRKHGGCRRSLMHLLLGLYQGRRKCLTVTDIA